jgi:hypothetical protein
VAVHRFAIHPRYWYVAAIVTVVSFLHSVLWLVQEAFYRHRFRATPVPHDPVFILGHWRSGTTLLHEVLIRDPRHGFPTTYQCVEPNHFLLTETVVTKLFPFLMPKRRPMDNMPAGWDRPQEDEFALCMMGQPSPYLHIAFPNCPPHDLDYLDFQGVPAVRRQRWSAALAGYLRRVSYLNPGKRLILKSPPHTSRVPVLLERFPKARFVHIVRNPFDVFPSTVRLWKALYRHHTLQVPDVSKVEPFVVECGRRLYAAIERDKHLIPPGRFVEVRYEELVRNPLGVVEHIYKSLGLGPFAAAEPELRRYVETWRDYRPNRHVPSEENRAAVEQHWGEFVRRYGYSEPSPAMN